MVGEKVKRAGKLRLISYHIDLALLCFTLTNVSCLLGCAYVFCFCIFYVCNVCLLAFFAFSRFL